MIVASKERYLPTMVNTIVLAQGEWYYYMHRDVYDQAVVLTDRYDGYESLAEAIGCARGDNGGAAKWFYDAAPKPLRVLAPFLNLVDGPLEEDVELCCGVLHVVTAMINVKGFPGKPPEVRKSVAFSLTIREEYEWAWERFFQSAIPYDSRHTAFGAGLAESLPTRPVVAVTDTVPLFPSYAAFEEDARGKPESAPKKASTQEERSATRSLLI
ncbi:hypothetical protein [Cohnella sp. GCM10027633]|uniref:hypothetical protein n=1 Tax=unclassified Cohnella TaxID=2636738 RepID=UPI00363658F5